jgi:molybdopterin/thiamine biosynthesis adenylyltransferase
MKHEIEYRGLPLIDKLAKINIVVCGVGALGSNLVDSLIRIGCTKIRVIDFDRVESHNMNNQVYDLNDVGSLKVAALQKRMFSTTKVKLEVENKKLEVTNVDKFLKNADLIVDCFDNSNSRAILFNYSNKTKTPTLHCGLIEGYGEVCWNDSYCVPKDLKGDVCDYPLARNLVTIIAAMTCEEIVGHVAGNKKKNLGFSLEGMKTYPL